MERPTTNTNAAAAACPEPEGVWERTPEAPHRLTFRSTGPEAGITRPPARKITPPEPDPLKGAAWDAIWEDDGPGLSVDLTAEFARKRWDLAHPETERPNASPNGR